MNTPTPNYPKTVTTIYNAVIKELGLPKEIASQFNITEESINDAYQQCIQHSLSDKQAEELILKMWKNSVQIK